MEGTSEAERLWQRPATSPVFNVPDDMFPPVQTFDLVAPKLARLGHEPIPISRPGDERRYSWITAGGKQPAQRCGWQNGCPLDQWQRYAFCGVGVLARDVPAVDIDVTDPELAIAIAGHASSIFGATLERIGRPPKRLLPYRLAGARFRKLRLDWDGGGVEILADGQQYVVAGIHPGTKAPYTWSGLSQEIWNVARDRLPPLSRGNAIRFMRGLARWLATQGIEGITAKGFLIKPPKWRPQPPPRRAGRDDWYLEAAITRGLENVRTAHEGARNEALFSEACALSRFIAQRRIGEIELETQLLRATPLPACEAKRTIASAFRRREARE